MSTFVSPSSPYYNSNSYSSNSSSNNSSININTSTATSAINGDPAAFDAVAFLNKRFPSGN